MAVDAFIKIGDIAGESLDSTYKDHIEVLSWSWGMTQTGSSAVGTGSGTAKVDISDLTFMKNTDASSTNLLMACAKGTHYDEAKLIMRKAAGDAPVEYLKVTMNEVVVSSVQASSAGEVPTESVSLNFAKVKVEYTPQEATGGGGGAKTMGWDLKANTTWG
jgi:type VI secretion system secreted protein Hcp